MQCLDISFVLSIIRASMAKGSAIRSKIPCQRKKGVPAQNACLHGLQPRQNKRKGSVLGTSPTRKPGAAHDQEQSESHKRRPRDREHGTGTGTGREGEPATQGHSQAARTGRGQDTRAETRLIFEVFPELKSMQCL